MPADVAGRLRRGAAGWLRSVTPDVDDITLVVDDDADVVALIVSARDDPDPATATDVIDIDQTAAAGDAHGLALADAVIRFIIVIGRRRRPGRARRSDRRRRRRSVDRRRNGARRRSDSATQGLRKRRRGRNQAETGGQDEATGQHGQSPEEACLA